jgi:uncharacterized protein (DUF2336 family)
MTDAPILSAEDLDRLKSGGPAVRAEIAAGEKTAPEVLFFLAADLDSGVREAVAENTNTPPQADRLLQMDPSAAVRARLGRRLARLFADEPDNAQAVALQAHAAEVLERLVADTALSVRVALAGTLCDTAFIPPHLARRLAEDAAREVAEPMLRQCAALSDVDLLHVLSQRALPWVADAIASRPSVSLTLSSAIYETRNATATYLLLDNDGAEISDSVLERIIDEAGEQPSWHAPLVRRDDLPPALARRMEAYLDESLILILRGRGKLETEDAVHAADTARRRLDFDKDRKSGEHPATRAARLQEKGLLTDQVIGDALSWGDRPFVLAALALRSGIDGGVVLKMIDSQSAKAVTALCWRAGLPMRLTTQIQLRLARIPHNRVLFARGGQDYPLGDVEMRWHLGFFGAGL